MNPGMSVLSKSHMQATMFWLCKSFLVIYLRFRESGVAGSLNSSFLFRALLFLHGIENARWWESFNLFLSPSRSAGERAIRSFILFLLGLSARQFVGVNAEYS